MKIFAIFIFEFSFMLRNFRRSWLVRSYSCLDDSQFIQGFIIDCLNLMILLDFVVFMLSSMKGQLSSLSEWLGTSINSAHKRFLICMDALMLFSILMKRKTLFAVIARESLLPCMNILVSDLGEFGCEELIALLTLIKLINLSHRN